MCISESPPGCGDYGKADPSAGAEQGEAVRSNTGLAMLLGWGCVVGHTAQAARFQGNGMVCAKKRVGCLRMVQLRGFCRKAGGGWDMGVTDPGSTWT